MKVPDSPAAVFFLRNEEVPVADLKPLAIIRRCREGDAGDDMRHQAIMRENQSEDLPFRVCKDSMLCKSFEEKSWQF